MLVNFDTDPYVKARNVLYERYGENFLVTQSLLKSLSSGTKIVGAQGLRQLADEISEAKAVMGIISPDADSQSFLNEVIKRCPSYVQRKWMEYALDIRENAGRYPGFASLEAFMRRVERRASDPVYGSMPESKVNARSNFVNALDSGVNRRDNALLRRCGVCDGEHILANCTFFCNADAEARHELARRSRVCYRCLLPGHYIGSCQSQVCCNHSGCRGKHHSMLHRDRHTRRPVNQAVQEDLTASSTSGDSERPVVRSSAFKGASRARVYLPVVPILVQGRRVHALLDTGSTSSLVSRDLVNRLGASGRSFMSEFQTVNGSRRVLTESIDLQVSPLSSGELYNLEGLLVVAGIPAEAPGD